MAIPAGFPPGKPEQQDKAYGAATVLSQELAVAAATKGESNLGRLLEEYTRLQKSLIEEIYSSQYNIDQESKARLQDGIMTTHKNEVARLHRAHEPQPQNEGKVTGTCSEHTETSTRVLDMSEKLALQFPMNTLPEGVTVPADVNAAPKVADEKRPRNATASHRFRQRRKEKEREQKELEKSLRERVEQLESQLEEKEVGMGNGRFAKQNHSNVASMQMNCMSRRSIIGSKTKAKAARPLNTSEQSSKLP